MYYSDEYLASAIIPPPPSPDTAGSREELLQLLRAWGRWGLEEEEARWKARRQELPPRSARGQGPTVVFSVRLDRAELAALERRSELEKVKPSVLARQYIRRGLRDRDRGEMVAAVQQVAARLVEAQEQLEDALG